MSEPLLVIANADAGTSDEERLGLALEVMRGRASVEVARTANPGELDGVLHRAGTRRIVGTGFAPTLTPRIAAFAANPGRWVVRGSIDPNLISSTLGRSHRAVCAYSEE